MSSLVILHMCKICKKILHILHSIYNECYLCSLKIGDDFKLTHDMNVPNTHFPPPPLFPWSGRRAP